MTLCVCNVIRQVQTVAHLEEYEKETSGVWDLLGVPSKEYNKMVGPALPQKEFSYVAFFVFLKRRPEFYLFHLALPIALFMGIGVFVFVVPPQSGEKVRCACSASTFILVITRLVITRLVITRIRL